MPVTDYCNSVLRLLLSLRPLDPAADRAAWSADVQQAIRAVHLAWIGEDYHARRIAAGLADRWATS